MSEQHFGSGAANISRDRTTTGAIKDAATDAFGKASELARDTGTKAKQAVATTTSTVSHEVQGMLDRQLSESWNVVGQVATSFKLAADDLDEKSPVAAGVVRNLAEKVQGYAVDFQDQTVEQMVRSASEFARRQPAVAFGLGALAGFFLFRTIKIARGEAATVRAAEPGGMERERMAGDTMSGGTPLYG